MLQDGGNKFPQDGRIPWADLIPYLKRIPVKPVEAIVGTDPEVAAQVLADAAYRASGQMSGPLREFPEMVQGIGGFL